MLFLVYVMYKRHFADRKKDFTNNENESDLKPQPKFTTMNGGFELQDEEQISSVTANGQI